METPFHDLPTTDSYVFQESKAPAPKKSSLDDPRLGQRFVELCTFFFSQAAYLLGIIGVVSVFMRFILLFFLF